MVAPHVKRRRQAAALAAAAKKRSRVEPKVVASPEVVKVKTPPAIEALPETQKIEEPSQDLSRLKKAELVALAEEREIATAGLTKSKLIDLLEAD